MTGSLYTFETGVFARCGKLREVSLPDGITEIHADTFREDYRLERVSLPDRRPAFFRYRNLTFLTFPDALISIGEGALFGNGLSSLVLPEPLRNSIKQAEHKRGRYSFL